MLGKNSPIDHFLTKQSDNLDLMIVNMVKVVVDPCGC